MRSLILLRATCEKVLERLDEDVIDDLALAVQITELCQTLDDEFDRFRDRTLTTHNTPRSA